MYRMNSIRDQFSDQRDEMNWMLRGRCGSGHYDADLWFPVGTSGPAVAQEQEAKAVCAGCPVLESCREWSIARRIPHGIFGGLNPDERAALARRVG